MSDLIAVMHGLSEILMDTEKDLQKYYRLRGTVNHIREIIESGQKITVPEIDQLLAMATAPHLCDECSRDCKKPFVTDCGMFSETRWNDDDT